MLEEYKYKTELHAHTKPISMCSDIPPEFMINTYKENGYTSLVLTNHFIYDDNMSAEEKIKPYMEGFYECKSFGEKVGLNVILGAEIRFSENENDYLIYGINEDDLYSIFGLLGDGIDNFYKKFKSKNNIILQAHPFRDRMTAVKPESLDGIEVFNVHPGHNSRIGFAAKYARENNFIITCGTDFHHFGHQALSAILTKEPVYNSEELAMILNNRDYVIDLSGYKILPY